MWTIDFAAVLKFYYNEKKQEGFVAGFRELPNNSILLLIGKKGRRALLNPAKQTNGARKKRSL